jgi:phosphoglycerol transferase MdoB-like AlkP superfamily enzyme
MLELVAFADIVWCAGSLVVKQAVVLAEADQAPSLVGRLLTLSGAAVVLLPLLVVPRSARPWVSWGTACLGTVVLHADLVYQRFFGDILSLSVVEAAGQVGRVRASVWSLLAPSDWWLWADLAGGLALMLVVVRVQPIAGRRWLRSVVVALTVLILLGLAAGIRLARSDTGILQQMFRNVFVARDLGVLNFHAYDVGRHLGRRAFREQLTDEQFERVAEWFSGRAPLRAGSGPWFGAARGLNLLMVQVESLQGFVLGLEVNGQEVTPFLNRWSEGAVVFDNVTDQTAQGRSSDSELATQVSLLPPPRGAAAFRYPNNRFTGLAGILSEHGYETLSAVPFDGAFWNRQLTHHAYGYSRSLFTADFEPGESIGWGLNDRAFIAQMVSRLSTLPRPFCAWLLTLGLHHPFEGFPSHHRLLELGAWEGTPFGGYLHTMSFFDRALEELIAGLDRAGLTGDTVVVLWGDHDAGLEWEPVFARIVGRRPDDAGWYLSQRVPLLIRLPNRPDLDHESDATAGHQDVSPTLLALLGVDPAPYGFVGRNLLGSPGSGSVVGEYHCWQDSSHLYLQRGASLADGECYELTTMERVGVEACREGYEDARRQVDISRLVLEHDLQGRVYRWLEERREDSQ